MLIYCIYYTTIRIDYIFAPNHQYLDQLLPCMIREAHQIAQMQIALRFRNVQMKIDLKGSFFVHSKCMQIDSRRLSWWLRNPELNRVYPESRKSQTSGAWMRKGNNFQNLEAFTQDFYSVIKNYIGCKYSKDYPIACYYAVYGCGDDVIQHRLIYFIQPIFFLSHVT